MYVKLRDEAERVRAIDTDGLTGRRIVTALQQSCDKIDRDRDWAFTYRTFSVNVLSGDQPILPDAFAQWGLNGNCAIVKGGTAPNKTLNPLSMWRYYKLRDLKRRGEPDFYAPGEGVDESGTRYFFLEPLTNR